MLPSLFLEPSTPSLQVRPQQSKRKDNEPHSDVSHSSDLHSLDEPAQQVNMLGSLSNQMTRWTCPPNLWELPHSTLKQAGQSDKWSSLAARGPIKQGGPTSSQTRATDRWDRPPVGLHPPTIGRTGLSEVLLDRLV
ncbi:hypothetical protein PCASD_15191 [Puccinia coronata f. sp. avenae]|uniref:Uncharacterized protein n=1 Tax=Puccinia coronata f. sp. avenae TaxID=200324 RepID=A0A2N5U0M7_9BASI|nr:hypothetical protein PCASD_15191 [Puccinia coronata f. sp. avenae]